MIKRLLPATLVALALGMPAMAESENSTLDVTEDMMTGGVTTRAKLYPVKISDEGDNSRLIASCRRGELNVFIYSDNGMSANYYGNTHVSVRWNYGKIYSQQWFGFRKSQTAFSKTGPEFMDAVIENDDLTLEWYTGDRVITAQFDLKDARENLKDVREACA